MTPVTEGAPAARVLVLEADDSVATTLGALAAGQVVTTGAAGRPVTVTLREAIPAGHKFALADIPAGAPVRKYGVAIGLARQPIAAGEHVHVHNLESGRGRGDRA